MVEWDAEETKEKESDFMDNLPKELREEYEYLIRHNDDLTPLLSNFSALKMNSAVSTNFSHHHPNHKRKNTPSGQHTRIIYKNIADPPCSAGDEKLVEFVAAGIKTPNELYRTILFSSVAPV